MRNFAELHGHVLAAHDEEQDGNFLGAIFLFLRPPVTNHLLFELQFMPVSCPWESPFYFGWEIRTSWQGVMRLQH
jgi:hypothetical protein